MSVFIEPDVAGWFRAKLVADATLLALLPDGAHSVFTSDPVQGATRPYLVIQLQGTEGAFRISGPTIFWEGFLFLVKTVGTPQQFSELKAIVQRAHTLIDNQTQQTQGDATIVVCNYERAFDPPADAYAGTLTKQLGGFYRAYGQAT